MNTNWLLNYKGEGDGLFLILSAVFFVLLFIISILISIFYKPDLKSLINYKNSWKNLFLYCAISGIVILFSRWQFLPLLGSRLLYLLVVGVLIIGSLYLTLKKITTFKKVLFEEKKEKILEKYKP